MLPNEDKCPWVKYTKTIILTEMVDKNSDFIIIKGIAQSVKSDLYG